MPKVEESEKRTEEPMEEPIEENVKKKKNIVKRRFYFRVGCHFSNEPADIIMNDEQLTYEDIKPDDPLFKEQFKDHCIGNMPELTSILQDEEILAKFQDEKVGEMMREIGLDVNNTFKYLAEDNEVLRFLIEKIDSKIDEVSKETRGRTFLDNDRRVRNERRTKEKWPSHYIREYSPERTAGGASTSSS